MGWYIEYRYAEDITAIKRNQILKYITAKDKKRINETVEKSLKKNIQSKKIKEIYTSFYYTFMETDTNRLDMFIDSYKESVLKGTRIKMSWIKASFIY